MDIFSNKTKADARETKDEAELRPWRQANRETEAASRTETSPPSVDASLRAPLPEAPAFRPAVPSPTPPENCASVVSLGSTWQGSLKIEGSVRIEGQLSGEIEAQDTVHIAESARVDAKISAAFVVVAGSFQGQMNCTERLELLPKSRTRGDLTAKLLTVHEGAYIDGQLHMTSDEPSATNATSVARPSVSPVRAQREVSPVLSGAVSDSGT